MRCASEKGWARRRFTRGPAAITGGRPLLVTRARRPQAFAFPRAFLSFTYFFLVWSFFLVWPKKKRWLRSGRPFWRQDGHRQRWIVAHRQRGAQKSFGFWFFDFGADLGIDFCGWFCGGTSPSAACIASFKKKKRAKNTQESTAGCVCAVNKKKRDEKNTGLSQSLRCAPTA